MCRTMNLTRLGIPLKCVAAVCLFCFAASPAHAATVTSVSSGVSGTGTGKDHSKTLRINPAQGETVKDFHICIGQSDTITAADVEAKVTFVDKPAKWETSVTKVGNNIYINFFAGGAGVALTNATAANDRKVRFKFLEDTDNPILDVGKPTYIFTNDGDADTTTGRLADPVTGPLGPVLVASSGRCDLPGGGCVTATGEACTADGGTFDQGGTCTVGACTLCLTGAGGCDDLSETECALEGGIFIATSICPDPDTCIPTMSQWGLAVLLLLVLTAGTIVVLRRREADLAA